MPLWRPSAAGGRLAGSRDLAAAVTSATDDSPPPEPPEPRRQGPAGTAGAPARPLISLTCRAARAPSLAAPAQLIGNCLKARGRRVARLKNDVPHELLKASPSVIRLCQSHAAGRPICRHGWLRGWLMPKRGGTNGSGRGTVSRKSS